MIYFFGGANAIDKGGKLVNLLRAKSPDAGIFSFDTLTWERGVWDEALGSTGLFVKKLIVYARNLSEHKEAVECIREQIKDIKESEHIYIFAETILGSFSKLLEKHATKAVVGKDGGVSKSEYNVFPIADAFAARDAKKTWIEFAKAHNAGVDAEDIHRILFWQAKILLLVKKMKEKSESAALKLGIKPYPFRKALSFEKKFEEHELETLLSGLLGIVHDSRLGKREFDIAIERWVLGV